MAELQKQLRKAVQEAKEKDDKRKAKIAEKAEKAEKAKKVKAAKKKVKAAKKKAKAAKKKAKAEAAMGRMSVGKIADNVIEVTPKGTPGSQKVAVSKGKRQTARKTVARKTVARETPEEGPWVNRLRER